MQQYKLIKKIRLAILNLLLINGVFADPIGDIIEQTGAGQIVRNDNQLILTEDFLPKIELYDTAETANGRMLIEFKDKAELALTEHTKILIDEVIYDPDPSKSKMTMQFVQGTARFASGKLAIMNKKNIDIKTPTATIGIRGTDFTTTVDEIGRSLIILLPDENGDASGEITVTNLGGTITLNEAYQATMVNTLDTPPSQTLTLNNITPNMIDNMFIVNPPPEVKEQIEENAQADMNEDQGILDVDFLAYDELDKDYDDYANDPEYDARNGRIDIDYLAGDFLPDLLDAVEELLRTTEELGDAQAGTGNIGGWTLKGAQFGLNNDSQYNVFEEDGKLVVYRNVNGVISITFGAGASFSLSTNVDGYQGTILGNGGDDIIILIKQGN
jgi:hypothetical protein